MYLLPRFSYYEPRDGDEACRLLSEMKENATVLAGGTDVLVNMKRGSLKTPNVVSILRIHEIQGVEARKECFYLGATLLVAEILESVTLRQHLPALVKAARLVGSPLIQNRATIGGNIVRASPGCRSASAADGLWSSPCPDQCGWKQGSFPRQLLCQS